MKNVNRKRATVEEVDKIKWLLGASQNKSELEVKLADRFVATLEAVLRLCGDPSIRDPDDSNEAARLVDSADSALLKAWTMSVRDNGYTVGFL